MKKGLFLLLISAVILIGLAGPASAAEGNAKTLVFAAASTTNAVQDIANLYKEKGLGEAVGSFASSSTLAKQIANGAPANIFISANVKWMDFLAEKKLIKDSSRTDLLGNRIVLIAPAQGGSADLVDIKPGFGLKELLKGGKLAMGDPDHVPAGIYGRQALEKLGVWASVEPDVARSKDVRAALALVERGECPYGVVYRTDAMLTDKVKIVGEFPEDSHPAIVYPVAVITENDTPAAEAFLEFLKTPEAKAIFEKYGFSVR